MPIVTPDQVLPDTEIRAENVNNPVNQIAELVNGRLDSANLADGAITSAKIANQAVTQGAIAPSAVATANLADGAVTLPKISIGSFLHSRQTDKAHFAGNQGDWDIYDLGPLKIYVGFILSPVTLSGTGAQFIDNLRLKAPDGVDTAKLKRVAYSVGGSNTGAWRFNIENSSDWASGETPNGVIVNTAALNNVPLFANYIYLEWLGGEANE